MKPDNIMVNVDPLEVRIIDFNRVNLATTTTEAHVRGTPGYFPNRDNWKNGDQRWDIWSMAAIILESDMILEGYYHTRDEQEAKAHAVKYLKEPKTCRHLNKIIRKTIVTSKVESIMSWEEMVKELKQANF